ATGRCFWMPATGMLGDKCTYPQFCVSGICQGTATDTICTQSCLVGASDSCPAGYDCVMTDGVDGICFPPASGGCCDAGPGGAVTHAGLAVIVGGLLVRRRRRT